MDDTSAENKTVANCFVGKWGSPTGFFFEIREQHDGFHPVSIVYGTRRFRQTWRERVVEIWREAWAVLRGRESTFEIFLDHEDTRRLKDVLRHL